MSQPFVFGRLSLAPLDLPSAIDWVLTKADQGAPCVVVTSNIHHLGLAERDSSFREVVSRAELNVADGWPLVLASRLLSARPLPSRVAGVDLVASVLASRRRLRVAVLGGAPCSAERLAWRFGGQHDFVLVESLPIGTWEAAEQLENLRRTVHEAAPNLILVAIGAPRQELLADSLRPYAEGPIICCGAAVEVIAGVRPRAPGWVQKLGLEWAFRAAMEPSRLLPRYLRASVLFLRVLVRELRANPSARRPSDGS